MQTYNPKSLGYTNYTRSNQPSPFKEYDKSDSSICWIDMLGMRGLNHTQILTAVYTALISASEASCVGSIDSNGKLFGTPNSAIQFSLVGDALVLTEKDLPEARAAAKLAFFYRVNILSRLLHERGYVHRGVITTGGIKCFEFEGSTIITGEGVVKAVKLESKLKTAGLFYDDTWTYFILERQQQIDNQNFVVPFNQIPNWNQNVSAASLAGVCFSQFEGWKYWKDAITNGDHTIDKISNAQLLIDTLKNQFNLP